MEGTVEQCHFDIHDGITSKHAAIRGFFDSFFNRVNVFFRNGATNDLVFKDNATAALARLKGKYNMPILTFTAGLFRVLVINFLDRFGDRFAERYARSANICLNAELAKQAIHNNIEV